MPLIVGKPRCRDGEPLANLDRRRGVIDANQHKRPLGRRPRRGLGSRLGIGRAVALLESTAISVPMVVGWLRPVVLIP